MTITALHHDFNLFKRGSTKQFVAIHESLFIGQMWADCNITWKTWCSPFVLVATSMWPICLSCWILDFFLKDLIFCSTSQRDLVPDVEHIICNWSYFGQFLCSLLLRSAAVCSHLSNIWTVVSMCSAAIGWQHCDVVANHKLELLSDYRMETVLQPHRLLNKNSIITHKHSIFVYMIRSDASSTWESFSSSSSCGTAPSSLARGNHRRRSCRPHHTRHCQIPLQQRGKLFLGKLLSAWRWRTSRGCGQLGPPQSRAVVRERKRYNTQIRAGKVLTEHDFIYHLKCDSL